ncbi:MAG: alpha/beta fold hydrolase [Deltaproteobacteria bacterium]|nr:alpha/beta fold hydrolase [Deltaproteobacteria bacterium]
MSTTTSTDTSDATDVAVVIPPYDPPPISWSPCGTAGWSCGKLVVPRDYADPDGPTLRVHVSLHRAADPERRLGVLLVNPGGPGGEAGTFARNVHDLVPEIARRFDVIGLDPRGTGESEGALDCLTDEELDTLRFTSARTDPEGTRFLVDYVRAQCAAKGAAALAAIGTTEVARDMESLRKALMEQQLNYLGASYGTALGATYAALYPDRVRAFVLDAPVSPAWVGPEILLEGARAKQAELERYLAWCAAVDGCFLGEDLDDVRAGWAELRARVDEGLVTTPRGPLPADELTGFVAAVLASGSGSTSGPDSFNLLNNFLQPILAQGDGSELLKVADQIVGRSEAGRYTPALLANLGVSCRDGLAALDAQAFDALVAEIARDAPDFVSSEHLYRACVGWAAPPAPPDLIAADAPPMLVLAGARDPSTPPAWGEDLVATLDNGSALWTWHGAGHVFSLRAKVADRVARFLVDPDTLEVDPHTCPLVSVPERPTAIVGSAAVRATIELRAPDDDRVLASRVVTSGAFEIPIPAESTGRWAVVRVVADGSLPIRRDLDLDQGLASLGTINTFLATNVNGLLGGVATYDEDEGVVHAQAFDCDGQSSIGGSIVIGEGGSTAPVVYADGASLCRPDPQASAVTWCGRGVAHGVPPGRHPTALVHGERRFEGPEIVVEAGGYTLMSPLTPR